MIPGPVQVRPLSDWSHENFQDQNVSLKVYLHHPFIIYHYLPKIQKELIFDAKVTEGPEAPEDLH